MRQQSPLNILAILLAAGLLSSTGLAAPGPGPSADGLDGIGLNGLDGISLNNHSPSGNRKRAPAPAPAPAPPIVKVADAIAEAAEKAQIDDLINKIAKTASDNAKSFIKVRRTTETFGKKGDDNAKGYIRRQKLALLAEQKKNTRSPEPILGGIVSEVVEGILDTVVDEAAAKQAAEEAARKIAKAGADAASGLIKKRRRQEQIEQIKKEINVKREPQPGFGDVIEGIVDVVVDDDDAAKKAAKKAADAAAGLIKRREQIERIKKEMR
ncbi:hypothetical protein V8F33_008961 [Rhypophila sp. PSN 637]